MQVKEINVFTNGDARKLSTWSNVPYFFTKTLKEKGIKVNYINTQPNKIIKNIYKFTIWQILKRIKKYDTYEYYRTQTNRFFANRIIKNAVKKYHHADANLFLNFSFSAKSFSKKPTILFGDWTYDLYFLNHKQRVPSCLEKKFIKEEDRCITSADYVFVLFPKVYTYMKLKYNNLKIYYIGNVVNTLQKINFHEIIQKKSDSKSILFIGDTKYKEGAEILIHAVKLAQSKYPNLEIHIVGMKSSDFEHLPNFVTCYGYLDKAKEQDRATYYNLLKSAKMIVNTTPKWSGFSSVIEAMYFYTPVITTAYEDFTETFGQEINFGILNQNADTLSDEILSIIDNDNYLQICKNAHGAVKDFTWSNYIDKFLKIIEPYEKTTA